MAIQLAARAGAQVFTTAGTAAKLDFCRELGADVTINYRDEDFVERIKEETDGAGVDVILDNMGAKYLARNVDALAIGGRLVTIGMQGGTKAELDLSRLMAKRAVGAGRDAARPPGDRTRRQGRDRGRGAARRLARRRARGRSGRSSTAGCRCPAPPRPTGSSRRASTSARSCCCPRPDPPDRTPAQTRTRTRSEPSVPTSTTSRTSSRDTVVQPRNVARPVVGRRPAAGLVPHAVPVDDDEPAVLAGRDPRDGDVEIGAVGRRIGGDRQVHRPRNGRVRGLRLAGRRPPRRSCRRSRAPRPPPRPPAAGSGWTARCAVRFSAAAAAAMRSNRPGDGSIGSRVEVLRGAPGRAAGAGWRTRAASAAQEGHSRRCRSTSARSAGSRAPRA